MEILVTILDWGMLLTFIGCITAGLNWYLSRKDKSSKKYRKSKKSFLILAGALIVSFVCASVAEGQVEEQQQAEAVAQKKAQDKKDYKKQKSNFIDKYTTLGYTVEDLSSKEGEEWEDAIDNSGDDFDVDSTIEDIEDNHSDDIDDVTNQTEEIHQLDQKIQDNSAASKTDKEAIHKAYLDMKHFSSHATDISGSYNDFTDEHNDMDRAVADRYEELQDL